MSLENVIAGCILNISKTYLNPEHLLAVLTPGKWFHPRDPSHQIGNNLSQIIYEQFKYPQVIFSFVESPGVFKVLKPGSFIFVIPPINSVRVKRLMYLMFMEASNYIGNSRGRVIIALMWPIDKEKSHAYASVFLQSALVTTFPDAIVLVPKIVRSNLLDNEKFFEVDVFGWKLHKQINICSKNIDTIEYLDTWVSNQSRYLKGNTLFESNQDTNMNGCTISAAIYHIDPFIYFHKPTGKYAGLFMFFLSQLCKRINCRIQPISDLQGSILSFPVIYGTWFTPNECQFLYPHFKVELNWFVPSGSRFPQWQCLVRTFSPLIWVSSFVVFCCGSFVFWFLEKGYIRPIHRAGNIVELAILTVLVTHVVGGVTDRYRGAIGGSFFVLWLFYCLVINTAYQSALYGVIVYPGEEPPIETLQELAESGLQRKTLYKNPVYGNFVDPAVDVHLYEFCTQTQTLCFKEAGRSRTQTLLSDLDMGLTISSHWPDEHEKPQMVPLVESYGTVYLTANISTLSCAVFDSASRLLESFVESGIFSYWRNRLNFILRYYVVKHPKRVKPEFSLWHLQGIFYLLLIGWLLAFLVFLIEAFLHFRKRFVQNLI